MGFLKKAMKVVTTLSKTSAKAELEQDYDKSKAIELNNNGIHLKNNGNYDAALIYFLQARQLVKYNTTVERNIDLCQKYIIEDIKQDIPSKELQAREFNRRGKDLANNGYYDGALTFFLEAEKLAQDNEAIKQNIALCRRKLRIINSSVE